MYIDQGKPVQLRVVILSILSESKGLYLSLLSVRCIFSGHSSNILSTLHISNTSPKVIKLSCSTQLSMKFSLRVNIKMLTIVGILIFVSRENSILG